MSTTPELGKLPPSPEVQREIALQQIRNFQSLNDDYRQLVALVHRFPTGERMSNLRQICRAVRDSSDPLIEASFYKAIGPELVELAVNALIDEILQNRELVSSLEEGSDGYTNDEFDDEFRQALIERVVASETDDEDEDEPEPIIVVDPLEQLSPEKLVKFMGGVHEYTVEEILENLEESESVSLGLEKEYLRQERVRTAVIGVVAFAVALGGSLLANRMNRRK